MSTNTTGSTGTSLTSSSNSTLSGSYAFGTTALQPTDLEKPYYITLFGNSQPNTLASVVHNKLFALREIPWLFSPVACQCSSDLLDELASQYCVGAAVTKPHDLYITRHVDRLSESAAAIGVIDTVFFRRDAAGQRVRIGGNTGVLGVRDAFLHNCSSDDIEKAATKPALIFGSGSAVRTAIYALWRCFGINSFLLANRSRSEAETLAAQFEKVNGCNANFAFLSSGSDAGAAETPHFVIAGIADEPSSTKEEHAVQDVLTELLASERRERGVLLDMSHESKMCTELDGLCETAGCKVIPGTEVAIRQALAQNVLWTEDAEVREEWVEEVRAAVMMAIEGRDRS